MRFTRKKTLHPLTRSLLPRGFTRMSSMFLKSHAKCPPRPSLVAEGAYCSLKQCSAARRTRRDAYRWTLRKFVPEIRIQFKMTLLPPTVEQQKRIDDEVPTDPEMRKRDIIAIREWLSKQPHLPNHMDDARLERFLFGCKNSIERCKSIMEKYFQARTVLTEFFSARDPLGQDIQECCETIDYFVLPSLTDEGHRVTILRLRNNDIEKLSIETITKRILMVLDLRLLEENGLSNIMIFDVKGSTAAHVAKCSPTQTIVRKAMLAMQDSMPLRLQRIQIINAPTFVKNILNVFYPFLKPKLVDKFRIHTGGAEELYPYVDKDILPNEWGGKAGTFQELNDAWRKKIEKNRDWFLREEKLSRISENARLPEMKSSCLVMDLDNMQGSFRKLNID
ncbi:hypothetical protein KM043_006841 [Ampulex compressa]|nr:hypothetical protein KM043_006841 [Ampulex compressa]